MKKINNKFYNNGNNNNTIYSLNYKFDSVCSAGKFSGTALDLIKKYNELAKEAHSNGNYVEMEVFRQYAEHYRKIVTEINERKNQRFNQNEAPNEEVKNEVVETVAENGLVETKARDSATDNANETSNSVAEVAMEETKPHRRRRSFTIVEVSAKEAQTVDVDNADSEVQKKPRRRANARAKDEISG